MTQPEIPVHEAERLDELKRYSILDTLPEEEYDNIVELASFICGTPVSMISLIDEKRQWFKAKVGLEVAETSREVSFCAHAINHPEEVFIVSDSRIDERFYDNPLVVEDPRVIFYAGVPLVTDKGLPLGTMCVIDHKPRELNEKQIKALKVLANQVTLVLEKRAQAKTIEIRNLELESQNKSLESFARVAAHDIKSPLSNISLIAGMLAERMADSKEAELLELLELLKVSSSELSNLIDGILRYCKDSSCLREDMKTVDIELIVAKLAQLLDPTESAEIKFRNEGKLSLFTNEVAVNQILLNLLSNSLKYNNKDKAIIEVDLSDTEEGLCLSVSDNGPGVPEHEVDKIFEIFKTTSNTDKNGTKGTGIGLATVKSLVDGIDARIKVNSNRGFGLRMSIYFNKV